MSMIDKLIAELGIVQSADQNKWKACCPAHEDRKASLSISQASDGKILLHCHAGCTFDAILAAVGMKPADLMPKDNTGGKPTIVSTYDYCDENGELLYQAVRYLPKDFKQRKPNGAGWEWKLGDVRRVPYRLPELLAADPSAIVFIPEGEKDVERLRAVGLVATCNVGGAGKWKTEYSQFLRDRHVVILPDNDDAGRDHAAKIEKSLVDVTSKYTSIVLPGLSHKGDVSDWFDKGGTGEQLLELAAELFDNPPKIKVETKQLDHVVPPVDSARFRPFPVECLPEPMRGFVTAASKAIGCDPSFVALPLLTGAGAAIGNTRRLEIKRGWSAPPILWTAIVGDSGTSKTPAFKLAMRPIRDRQRRALERHGEAMRQHDSDLAHYEKELAEWKRQKGGGEPPEKPEPPAAERYIVSDSTVEALAPLLLANPRGLLLARDELAGWIGSFDKYSGGKGGDSSHWLSMHNGESVVVDRKTGLPRTIFVPSAAVSVCGGIQPGILHRSLGREHRESGLAARLLLACPPRQPKRWTEADIDPEAERDVSIMFDGLYDLQPDVTDEGERPIVLKLTPAAKEAFKRFYDEHAQEQAELTGDLSAAWSKLEEAAARLALVLHLVYETYSNPHDSEGCVDVDKVDAGILLVSWFKNEARRVYSQLGETDEERDCRHLVEWIQRRGGKATAREVQQGVRLYRSSGEAAEKALNSLVQDGYGTWEHINPAASGGRPTRVFNLVYVSTVYGTPANPSDSEGFVDDEERLAIQAEGRA